jgi:16S rRNA C1402 N4-methylase RsmH
MQADELAAIRLIKCGKAIKAEAEELARNTRARSAIMRVAERK